MPITREPFGEVRGQAVERFTLSDNNVTVKIISYGGRITEIHAPDRAGKLGNITLGFDKVDAYVKGKAFLGTLVGPVANRIANANFTLDGKTYKLTANDGPHTLHSGLNGFDKAVWQPTVIDDKTIELKHTSRDGTDGFPGSVTCVVRYTLAGKKLTIDYTANTDQPTPINFTNHAYFNLAGAGSGDILRHEMTIAAASFTPVDGTRIPTGEIKNVQGTPMDFRSAAPIGETMKPLGFGHTLGYDHNFVLDARGDVERLAASVREPDSGRVLNVYTTEPGVQFYCGSFLDGSETGNGGAYQRYGGFCLETQAFPNAINQPKFPSSVLQPTETYRQTTVYEFLTD